MLPAPTAPSEGYAGVRNLIDRTRRLTNPLSILAHQLRRRFRSGISLFREARLTYPTTWPESSLVVRSAWPGKDRSPNQNHPMFRGPSWETHYRVSLRSPRFRRTSGAASHDRKISLPAPLPGWPRSEPESSSQLPAGGDRTFGHLPHRLALAGLSARPGPPSRSPEHHAPLARVAKAKNRVRSLWITWISGTTIGTFLKSAVRLPIRSPCPTSRKCLNPLH